MKKIIALLLAAVMVMCLFAGCASSGGSKVIKIGVFEPQSGDNGAGGKQEVLGIQYANSVKPTVTINGEEYKIELDIQDNQSSTDKAVSAAQQLVADKVSVVLGSYGSGVSIAAGTYFANAKIPAIGCSCTNAAVPAVNDTYFRVYYLPRSVPGLRHGLVRHGRVRRQEGLCPVDARRRLHRRPGQELCKGL